MGISAAMTPKDRKEILRGLQAQGATIRREGKRGTILNLPNGGTFIVPGGTSDYKARLAMRAEVRREGLHWPLDPPEQEATVTPIKQLVSSKDLALAWLDEYMVGRGEVAVTQIQHAKPDAFSQYALDQAMNLRGARRFVRDPERRWIYTLTRDAEEAAEQAQEAAEEIVQMTEEDQEIGLAEEQEQRAIRAERDRDTARASLEAEKAAHAKTRTNMMTKIATIERTIDAKDTEIRRLRSLIEEREAEDREVVSGDESSVLRRAHEAEAALAATKDDVEELTARLRSAENAADEARNQLRASTPVEQHDGWWPMEPQKGQTMQELLSGASTYGLEIRVQARRR